MKKKLGIVLILCMMVAMFAACNKETGNSATRTKIIRTVLTTQEKTPAASNATATQSVTSATTAVPTASPTVAPTTAPATTRVPTVTPTNRPANTSSAVAPTTSPTKTPEVNPVVKLSDSRIRHLGRVLYQDDVLYSSFTASGVEFKINGTGAKATMQALTDKPALYLAVFVDGVRKDDILVKGRKQYTLCENLSNGPHTVKLVKSTEMMYGTVVYFDLQVQGTLESRPAAASKKLEFYGDSITCGWGAAAVVDSNNITGAPEDSDGFKTYAAYTASDLKADFNVISKSGSGVVRDGAPMPHGQEVLISDIYDNYGINLMPTTWNFANYTPDVVVLNLGTNDSIGGRVSDQEIADGVRKLIRYMHDKYPKAKVVWAYGMMEDRFSNQIKNAVEGMNVSYASYLQLPLMTSSRGGHPSAAAHREAADALTAYLKNLMGW